MLTLVLLVISHCCSLSSVFPSCSSFLPVLSVIDHQWRTMSVPDRSPHQAAGPNLVNIEVMRNHSELFRAECMRLMLETDKTCKRMQDDDNKRLGKRGNSRKPATKGWCNVAKTTEVAHVVFFSPALQISGSETSSFWRRSWSWSWRRLLLRLITS